MEEISHPKSFWSFDNLSLFVLFSGFLILPVFTLPFWATSLEISKHLLLVVTVFLSFTFWLLGRLQAGKLVLPRNLIVVGAFGISFIALLSAAFNKGSFWTSFSGLGYELDTFLNLFSLTLLLFLFGIYFQSRKRFLSAYIGLFAVATIFFLLEFLAVIVLRTSLLTFLKPLFVLPFNNLLTSLVGKWYDFGVYAGFILLSSLIMLEFFSLREMPIFKIFLTSCFILSLLCLIFINYLPVWIVLACTALILFVYKISFWGSSVDKEDKSKKITKILYPSFVVVLIALFFVTLGGADKLGLSISRFRDNWGVPVFEVKPSWRGTWNIAEQTLAQQPLLGVGPNQFVNEWVKFKPTLLNNTYFWNIDFRYGVGLLPSLMVTTGLLGILSWLIFFAAILWYGLRFIFTLKQDKSTRALLLLSFLGSLYLWLFTVIYVPDTAIIALAFMITGLFVAILTDTKIIKYEEISLVKNPRHSFLATLIFVLLIIGTITLGYLTLQKYVSVYLFQKGLVTLNQRGDIERGRLLVTQAASLSQQDIYYRTLSEIDLVQINQLLNNNKLSKEELRVRFLAQTDSAIKNALQATKLDSANYLNWLSLGRVYEALVPLGIEKAYEQGQAAFVKAKELKPTDPAILLNYFARLEISNKNLSKARNYVKDSLAIKNDYAPAVSLLAQLDAQEGNLDVAARRLEEFLATFPQYNDAGLYFQLGFLKYQRNNYQGAIIPLERAIAIVPNFSNARYFLGLSYENIGNKSEALKQFREILKLNPANKEVEQLISRLSSPVLEISPTATTTKAKQN